MMSSIFGPWKALPMSSRVAAALLSGFLCVFFRLLLCAPYGPTKAKVLPLFKWYLNRESKIYLCTSDKAGFFLVARNMTRLNVGHVLIYVNI